MMRTRELDVDALHLEHGSHNPNHTFCLMEAVAFVAGEDWSDHPKCVSPVLGAYGRGLNDSWNDEQRQKLKPYIAKVIGTNTGKRDDNTRAWLATDWLVRVCAPAFLRLSPVLVEHAETLIALPEIRSAAATVSAKPKMAAAGAAARAAAGDAAGAAAGAALAPTIAELQASALDLFDSMIAVGK